MGSNKKKVLILGGTGMLGSMLTQICGKESTFEVTATQQTIGTGINIPTVRWLPYSVTAHDTTRLKKLLADTTPDYIVNAIGLIKHKMSDALEDNLKAIAINSEFPIQLSALVGNTAKIIQVCTDCVYAGKQGSYVESDRHDAEDFYGKTKSVGENVGATTQLIRCSIIGPEQASYKSLLEWVLRQPHGATITGFTNHLWNGVTTLHFAKLCVGLIKASEEVRPLQHFIPANSISKANLVRHIANVYGRTDLTITSGEAHCTIDRTLSTIHPEVNAHLWLRAGYNTIPTIETMVTELATHHRGAYT